MDGTALVYTNTQFTQLAAKTAHGLLRHGKRYQILAVLDSESAGQDSGIVMEGKANGIPIVENLEAYLNSGAQKPDYLIIGIASAGGKIDPVWLPTLRLAIEQGISLVNGMHHKLEDHPELAPLAQKHGVKLVDVRKAKPIEDLSFWSGEVFQVGCPILPVIGTDCAVGKRTTARFLEEALEKQGIHAPMIYTGQTGWLQGGKYGFIFDSTLNDFVSGELEAAIVRCWKEVQPDLILVEGQAALRNLSGPCGSEMLVSGRADACILIHPAGRTYYKGWESTGKTIPPLADEIDLVRAYGVPTIGIALNTKVVDQETAFAEQSRLESELGLPVSLPIEEGVDRLLPVIHELIQSFTLPTS